MSTEFYNRNWRMPNSFNGSEDNNSKFSNYSMSFDGSSEHISVSSGTSFDFGSNPFSFSGWIKRASIGDSTNVIIHFQKSGSTPTFQIRQNARNIKIDFNVGGVWSFIETSTNPVGNDTDWHHLIITKVGTSMSIYFDGVLQKTGAVVATLDSGNGSTLIGARGGNTQNWTGKIDHVAIFDYALTQPQITALYGSSSTGVGNPMAITNGRKPVAYYPLGDYSAYNGTEYLVPNSAVSDYVFEIIPQGDYINCGKGIGNSIGDNYTGGLTISGWINPNTTTSDDGVLQFGNFTGYEMALVLNASKFIFYNNGQKFAVSYTNPNNEWTNFALTFLPSSSVFYVNGVVAANWTYTDLDLNNLDFIIGSYYNAGFNLTGEVSNFSVFNTALPATGTESVASLYNYGTPPDISSYSGLQGFWKLDASATFDGSNWSIPDSSSNSNTGTSSGMTAANLVQSNLNILSPYSRYALDFDGSSDYIDTSQINLGSTNSISFWINRTSTAEGTLFGDPNGTTNYALYIYGSEIYFRLGNGDGGFYKITPLISSILSDGNWHHHCLSRDSGTINYYIDKVLQTNVSNTLNTSAGTNTTIENIFAKSNGTSPISGILSNVSLWNASLTSAQVTEIYNNGLPSNLKNHSAYSNLVSWWQLGENMSYDSNVWTVIDEKGTNNGTGANLAPAEDSIVNGVGTSGNGLSDGMGGADNIIGDAPYSTANAVSYGMGVDAKSNSVPS